MSISIVLWDFTTTSASWIIKVHTHKESVCDNVEVRIPESSTNWCTLCVSHIWREAAHTLCSQQPSCIFVGLRMSTRFQSVFQSEKWDLGRASNLANSKELSQKDPPLQLSSLIKKSRHLRKLKILKLSELERLE